MSREIKFRAWRKEKKIMGYPYGIIFSRHVYLFLDGIQTWLLDEIELMQYTGLKDKNGREIYEGDILEIEGATAVVTFWEKPPEFGLNFYHNEEAWCEDWNLSDDSDRMTIIGNIYEHPALLQGEKSA